MPVEGFRVSGEVSLIALPLAAKRTSPKTGLELFAYFPRAVMIASATFFGASL